MFWNENAEQKIRKIFEGQRQDTGAITVIYTTDIDVLNDLLFELPEEIGSVLLVRHASKTTQKVIDLPRRLDA
jgi:hypothetical protein